MMTFAFYNSSMNTEVALQPQPWGTESWTVGALEVSCCDYCRGCSAVSLSLAAESFWHRASWKLAAALWTEPRHFGLSMAYLSMSLGLMWHHWRLNLTVFLYRRFGLPWFLLPAWGSPYIRRLGIRHSSIRITCPTHRSWALMVVASMLVDLAWSKTFRLVMWSCHLISRMERRARTWKSSSFLLSLFTSHNHRGGREEPRHCKPSVS